MDPAALNLTTKVLGFGRFLFVEFETRRVDSSLLQALEHAAAELDNMHFASGQPAAETLQQGRIQYVRADPKRLRKGDIVDDGVSLSAVLIRVEGITPEPLLAYERRLRALVDERGGRVHTHEGVRKDRSYTSYAMNQFAYARALAPDIGARHPVAVFLPQSKTKDWWAMDWMRRESLFLPQYSDDGTVRKKGHVLLTAEGIPHIVRRLYHHPLGYGLESGYDFLGYFEFAAEHARVFDSIMAGLRDHAQNPEWDYFKEGPEWWGRRVGTPAELWG